MKKYLSKLLLLLITFATLILLYLVPQFYFNELEMSFRKDFYIAHTALAVVEDGIALRQQGVESLGEEQFSEIGKKIEKDLDTSVEYLEKARGHNQQQQNISIILPGKYKEYLKLKQKSVDEYYDLAKDFRKRKQNEHVTTETLMTIVQIDNSIYALANYDQWVDTMESLEADTSLIKTNAKMLLDADHIDENVYQFFTKTADGFLFLQGLYIDSLEKQDFNGIDFSGLDDYFIPDEEVKELMGNTFKRWSDRNQAYFEKMIANDEEIVSANQFYNDNKLGYDPLSILLSKFNNTYPKIRIINDREPTILPPEVEAENVSWILD